MTTERLSADLTGEADDNLTELTGLGNVAQRDLHSIGIRRFDDFLPYTPEELARRLSEQTGTQRYSAKFITSKGWISQARRRVEERKKLKASLPRESTAATRAPRVAEQRVEGWRHHAEFTLYFEKRTSEQGGQAWQTRVWHTYVRDRERDKEVTFDGLTPAPWVKWIFEQAELSGELGLEQAEPEIAAPPAPPAPVTPAPGQVSLLSVELEPKMSPHGCSKQLLASLRFTISGSTAEPLTAARTPYQILLLIEDAEHNLPKLVAAEQGLLQPGQLEYAHQLAFPLPDLGRYELQTIVLVQSQIGLAATRQGPSFTIIP